MVFARLSDRTRDDLGSPRAEVEVHEMVGKRRRVGFVHAVVEKSHIWTLLRF